ncbi:hypothetical protein [Vulgatibacter sp.]|uniref:hypothetical protein n=1 Tax=Vulgatibacter sp. TaxID=1971226 RepID=UPI00356AD758
MRVFGIGLVAGGLLLGFAACGSEPADEPAGQQPCVGTESCTCTDGSTGTRSCTDGSWSACACESGTGGTGGGAGGTGGVGGSGGVGGTGGTAGAGGSGGAGGAGGSAGSGGAGGSTPEPVCAQVPDCEFDVEGDIDEICTLDGCVDAGVRGGGGTIERGEIKVFGQSNPVTMPVSSIKSYAIRVYHPITNTGELLDCETILAAPDRYDGSWNVLRRSTGDVPTPNEQIPAQARSIPVNDESTPLLAELAFFGGRRDTSGEPQGSVIAVGCADGIRVVPGPFVNDEDHVYATTMQAP